VSRRIPRGLNWARILVPIGFIIAVLLLITSSQVDEFVISMTLITAFMIGWIGIEWYAARIRLGRMWVRDLETGFELITGQGRSRVTDSSVTSLAQHTQHNQTRGVLSSITRRFCVWSDELPHPVTLESTLSEHQPDPLAALTSRLWQQVVNRTLDQLRAGQPFRGEKWTLTRDTFTWEQAALEQKLAREDIDACEVLDGQVCLWRIGHDDAFAKFPIVGRNVCLLPQVLLPARHPNARPREDYSPVLGRVLYEFRPTSSTRLLGYVGGGVAMLSGAALLINRESIGFTMFVAGALWFAWAYWKGFAVLRCQERGVHVAGLLTSRGMRYSDMAAFSFSEIQYTRYGIYTGTGLKLAFVPMSRINARTLCFSETIIADSLTLSKMVQIIAAPITARMEARLSAGNIVSWTPNLKLSCVGIEYIPRGMLGRQEARLLTYSDCSGHTLHEGFFSLYQTGQKEAVLREPVAALNFFPGFYLFLKLKPDTGCTLYCDDNL